MVRRIITSWEANYNRKWAIESQGAGPISSTEEDDYVSRIVKLIPAEIIAAFVATEAALSLVTDISVPDMFIIKAIIFIVLQIMTIFYLLRVVPSPAIPNDTIEKKKAEDARRLQIVVSCGAFFVWVFTLGGPFSYLPFPFYHSVFGTIMLPLYTLLIPVVFEKEN